MRALIVISLVLVTGCTKSLPPTCNTQCVAPYGQVLGRSPAGVVAYANCSARCVSKEPNAHGGRYVGMRWQCVEYARRWLLLQRGVVFGDVDVAADIWKFKTFIRVADKVKVPVIRFANGAATRPQVGDLMVYARSYLGTGHVAVVVSVDSAARTLSLAEQNYRNAPWQADHARKLSWTTRDGAVRFEEPHLLGWLRLK